MMRGSTRLLLFAVVLTIAGCAGIAEAQVVACEDPDKCIWSENCDQIEDGSRCRCSSGGWWDEATGDGTCSPSSTCDSGNPCELFADSGASTTELAKRLATLARSAGTRDSDKVITAWDPLIARTRIASTVAPPPGFEVSAFVELRARECAARRLLEGPPIIAEDPEEMARRKP